MSKFNVLSPEVDIDFYNVVKKNSRKKVTPVTSSQINSNKIKKTTKTIPNNVPPKKKVFVKDDDLQNLAFSTGPKKGNKQTGAQKPGSATVPNKPNAKKVKPKVNNDAEVEWKRRDDMYVTSVNDKNLEEAILLSKLENQKKVRNGPSEEKENSKPKNTEETKKKKKKKPTTISLDEFQRATPEELVNKKKKPSATATNPDQHKKKNKKPKEDFVKDVKESTKSTLLTEKRQASNKSTLKYDDRKIMADKFEEEVQKRDYENQALRLEVEALNKNLGNVKQRNKKLCEVIGCSEMKPKGELVVQLEKAIKTRDEYSEEVSKLSVELEQEKTKVSMLNQEIKKLQGRKKTADN